MLSAHEATVRSLEDRVQGKAVRQILHFFPGFVGAIIAGFILGLLELKSVSLPNSHERLTLVLCPNGRR